MYRYWKESARRHTSSGRDRAHTAHAGYHMPASVDRDVAQSDHRKRSSSVSSNSNSAAIIAQFGGACQSFVGPNLVLRLLIPLLLGPLACGDVADHELHRRLALVYKRDRRDLHVHRRAVDPD